MATGDSLGQSSGYMASDEGFDHECDPCKLDDIYKEGKYYCPTCEEYLCETCYAHHRKLKGTRMHQIIPSKDMPMVPTSKPVSTTVACSCGQCNIKWFCQAHSDTFCETCKRVKHKSCKAITLDEAIKIQPVGNQFDIMVQELDRLIDQTSQTEDQQAELLNSLAINESSCEEDVRALSKELKMYIDKLEKESLDALHSLVAGQKRIINDRKSICSNVLQTLKASKLTAMQVKNNNHVHEMFVHYNRISQNTKGYKTAVEEIRNESTGKDFCFEKDEYISELPSRCVSLGKWLGLEENVTSKSLQKQRSFLSMTAELLSTMSIPNASGQSIRTSYGAIFLESGDIVICDYDNGNLLLLDSLYNKKDEIKISRRLHSVTEARKNEVICSTSTGKTLYFVAVYPKFKILKSITLKQYCYGVKFINDTVVVSMADHVNVAEVRLLTYDGKVTKTIKLKSENDKKTPIPYNLALSPSEQKLFVSDYDNNSVKCFSVNGGSIFTYTHEELIAPADMIVDSFDNLIVCSQRGNNIHVINSDGTFHKTIFDVKNPLMFAFRESDGTLIVHCGKGKFMVYKCSFE